MPPKGFENAFTTGEQPHTHALDRVAIRIDLDNTSRVYIAWTAVCIGHMIFNKRV